MNIKTRYKIPVIFLTLVLLMNTECAAAPIFAQATVDKLGVISKDVCLIPTINKIQVLDSSGNDLYEPETGWYKLKKNVIIRVEYKLEDKYKDISENTAIWVQFFATPTGTETWSYTKVIGVTGTDIVKMGDGYTELNWTVPDSFMGYIYALVFYGDVAKKSSLINAIYEK